MEVVFLGHSCFKISGKDKSVVIDPFSSKVLGYSLPKVKGEIVLCTHDHEDHNMVGEVDGVERVISEPGEYEIGGVSVFGIPTFHDDKKGRERGENIVYFLEVDGVRLCHLGDLGHSLAEKQVEEIGDVDVLMVPVGGVYTIDSEKAVEVTSAIDPRIIIPMHYKEVSGKVGEKLESVEKFVEIMGVGVEKKDKLTVKQGSLPQEGQTVVLLERK